MGFFDRIKRALVGTRNALAYALRRLRGRIINEEFFDEVYQTLLASDIGIELTEQLVGELRAANARGDFKDADQLVPLLKARLKTLFPAEDLALRRSATKPTVVFVVGVNGSGKTTSVAKLAHLLTEQGQRVLLAACDTFRAAAIEQLTIWSQRAGVDIVKHQHGGDPGAVAFDACSRAIAGGYDTLLVDTAGRLHTQKNLMDELDKIRRVIAKRVDGAPHETLLVLDATTGQNAVRQAEVFGKVAGVTGVFLSKLDGSAKGGVAVAIRQRLGIPVKLVGLGETPQDVAAFDPDSFVDAMFDED